jgi:hypothetical protein
MKSFVMGHVVAQFNQFRRPGPVWAFAILENIGNNFGCYFLYRGLF